MKPEIQERIEQIRRGEIPDGYKHTKAGIIPNDWNENSVGNCVQEYKRLSNDVASIPVYSSSRKGLIPQSEYYDQKEATETNLGYKVVPPGYVTYRHMSDDDIFHFNVNKTNGDILVSSEYPVFTTSGKCDLGFLIPALNEMSRFRYFCRTQKLGGTRTRLYFHNLAKYRLGLPTLSEQHRIAEILSAQDKIIELKTRLVTEKLRQKKYLMQQLLTGKRRFPGFSGEWKSYIVGEIGAFYGGLSGKSKEDFGIGSSSYITFKNVLENVAINPNQLGRVQLRKGEKQNAVRKFDLFFNLSSETAEEVGMCAVLLEDLRDTYLNSFCTGFRIQNKAVLAHWLSYYFNSPVGREKMRSLAQGITRVNLNRKAFSNLEISVPSGEEQRAIADILSAADREIELLRASLEQEKRRKKALSQLLLTGIVRV